MFGSVFIDVTTRILGLTFPGFSVGGGVKPSICGLEVLFIELCS